eukprot:a180303_28.p1 GENE.a180303_28~~a180303_28.p1  ORF type:complete len:466 (+),score=125.92 a180303_28:116-1399(+)
MEASRAAPLFASRRTAVAAAVAASTLPPTKVLFSADNRSLVVDHDGDRSEFHFIWLRDNCVCPECRDPHSGQKKINAFDIAPTIEPESWELADGRVRVDWRGRPGRPAHRSSYELQWLIAHRPTSQGAKLRAQREAPSLYWDRSTLPRIPVFEHAAYMADDGALFAALDALHNVGVIMLRGVPVDTEQPAGAEERTAVAAVAKRIGVIQETFYGKTFDVRSVPEARNVAYTSVELPPHTDLCYLEAPPGVQMLHALVTDARGGESYFVDAHRIAFEFERSHPAEFDVLTRVPLTFHYKSSGQTMRFVRPLFARGDANEPVHVNWSPPFEGPLTEVPPGTDMGLFYKAYARFHAATMAPAAAVQQRLTPGELVMFLNRRVLHARRAFDPSTGTRLLRGTYVSLSDFKSRWRTLRQQFGAVARGAAAGQ